ELRERVARQELLALARDRRGDVLAQSAQVQRRDRGRGGRLEWWQDFVRGREQAARGFFSRALRRGVQAAQRIDLVPQKVQPNRPTVRAVVVDGWRGRIHVHDAAAPRKLAGVLDEGYARVAQRHQALEQSVRPHRDADAQLQGSLAHRGGGHYA